MQSYFQFRRTLKSISFMPFLLALALVPPNAVAQDATDSAPASLNVANEQAAERVRTATNAALGTLPANPDKASADGQMLAALKRRLALLDEMEVVRSALKRLERTRSELPGRTQAAETALKDLSVAAESLATTAPSQADYDAIEKALGEARNDLAAKQAAETDQQDRFEVELPKLIEDARRRGEEALKRQADLESLILGSGGEVEKGALIIQAENAGLDAIVAQQQAKQYTAELVLAPDLQRALSIERDLAEKRYTQLEQQFARYSEAFGQTLARETLRADAGLSGAQRAVEEAKTPAERFAAEWDLRIARSEKGHGEVEALLINARRDAAAQQNRLAIEMDEAAVIKDLVGRPGAAEFVGERIQFTLQQLRQRQDLLGRALETGLVPRLNEHRARRFAVDDSLIGLGEQFTAKRDALAATLTDLERRTFVARTNAQLDTYRTAARDEKSALSELISLAQQMQALTLQRMETLKELQGFIRAYTFWLRDGKPLSPAALSALPEESGDFAAWVSSLASGPVRARLSAILASPVTLIYALLLFPVLPVALYLARQRVRAVTRSINDRVVADGRQLRLGLAVIATGVVSAALVPLYFLAGARMVGAVGLPASIGTVLATFFEHLAYFLFLWFLSRSFFSRRSIAEVQFGMPAGAAHAFHSGVGWILFGYVFCLLPWLILSRPPFDFVALPRVFYTLFLAAFAIGVVSLVRAKSPYVQHMLGFYSGSLVARHWSKVAGLLIALAIVILLSDIVGYRYSSRSIIESLAASLALLIVLPPVYRYMIAAVQAVTRKIRSGVSELTGEEGERPEEIAAGAQRSIRLLFLVLGVVLLARFWGFDQQALQTLDEMRIYSVRVAGADPEFVTAGDLVRAMLMFVGTFWILRALPGLFEVAIFPRFQMDEGVKYATLTISRYTVFVVGIFFALSAVHLDLGRLGWLMAAIGVGLGFGLQQIVSNFVSGIILLVERPVRPGDTVTIGDISGKVQRINIRATTISNFDRQEVVVPNSSLITGNVTNWTRSDKINRLVIPIGVAYGSDIDQVSALLLQIAKDQPEVMSDPAPSVVFMAHGESSLDFNLRAFVPNPDDIMKLRNRLNTLINKAFAEANIEIPFPQRDLHIRSSELPLVPAVPTEGSS